MHASARVTHTFAEGEIRLTLEGPADPDGLVREAERAGDPGAGYWAHLWPASRALASFVARSSMVGPGVRVLEIGCGLGLAGFVAAARGAQVRLTDIRPEALELARDNAFRLGLDVCVERLDWNALVDHETPVDVLLGADVLFSESAHGPIAAMIAQLGAVALLADPNRRSADGFAAALDARGVASWVTRLGPGVRLFVCQPRAGS